MGDLYSYCYTFLMCNSSSWKPDFIGRTPIGFQIFFRIVGQLGLGFEVCLFIIAAFSAITLGVLIFRYSPSPFLSYMLYICMGNYIFTLSGLKQTIAMGFITIAMMEIFESKPLRFFFLVIAASLFHKPAIIFLIAYPFARKKIDIWYFLMIFAAIIGVFAFRSQIVSLGASVYYTTEVEFDAQEGIGGKFIILVLILLASVFIRPVRNYETNYRYLFNIVIIATIIQSFSVYDNVFTRLSDYFFQFFVIFVPVLFESGDKQAEMYPDQAVKIKYFSRSFYLLAFLTITTFSFVFYIKTLNAISDLLSEFHFFWETETPYSLDLMGEFFDEI